MKKIITTQRYLLSKRAKIIKFLKEEGYSGADIAIMFNIDRSGVNRILITEEKYKNSVKRKLSNKIKNG